MIGIDLAKNSFQAHGARADGSVDGLFETDLPYAVDDLEKLLLVALPGIEDPDPVDPDKLDCDAVATAGHGATSEMRALSAMAKKKSSVSKPEAVQRQAVVLGEPYALHVQHR